MDLHTSIRETFQKNIDYLEATHKSLYEKLLAYENALSNNLYQEKYELRYENGDFDIYIKSEESFLYKRQPKSFVEKIINSVSFSREENVFVTFKEGSFNLQAQEKEMQQIYKMVFFGVATGSHIKELHNRLHSLSYFIIENDLELFRLSLMTTPYFEIAQTAELFFSVFDEYHTFNVTTKEFLENQFYCNHYIKFLQIPDSCEDKLKLLHLQITQQSHLNFGYKSILSQYVKPLTYIDEGYKFLNILEESFESVLQDKPILLLAPGPSLGKNLEWLQEHQNNFLLVALSATLPILQKSSVVPDIVIHLDGFSRSIEHFERLNSLAFLEDTTFLFSARTPNEIVNQFEKEKIFFFENGTSYKKDFGNFSAFCAGSSAYLILIALQVKKLYLLGLDLAVDAESLQTHSDGYAYTLETKRDSDVLSFRDSLISVEGNFEQSVATTPNFALSINAINEISAGLKMELQKVYNLNEGAKFKTIEALRPESVQEKTLLDKKAVAKEISKSFNLHSQNFLTQEEKNAIENSKIHAQKLKELLQRQKNKRFMETGRYLESLIKLDQELTLEAREETMDLVLKTYMYTVFSFIVDYFNVGRCSQSADEINELVTDEMLELVNIYLKNLNIKVVD